MGRERNTELLRGVDNFMRKHNQLRNPSLVVRPSYFFDSSGRNMGLFAARPVPPNTVIPFGPCLHSCTIENGSYWYGTWSIHLHEGPTLVRHTASDQWRVDKYFRVIPYADYANASASAGDPLTSTLDMHPAARAMFGDAMVEDNAALEVAYRPDGTTIPVLVTTELVPTDMEILYDYTFTSPAEGYSNWTPERQAEYHFNQVVRDGPVLSYDELGYLFIEFIFFDLCYPQSPQRRSLVLRPYLLMFITPEMPLLSNVWHHMNSVSDPMRLLWSLAHYLSTKLCSWEGLGGTDHPPWTDHDLFLMSFTEDWWSVYRDSGLLHNLYCEVFGTELCYENRHDVSWYPALYDFFFNV